MEKEIKVKFCPNCKGDLKDKKYLAQHVKECDVCKARYFVLETTPPKVTTPITANHF